MSDSYKENLNYHFGDFILDTSRGGLYRGDTEVRIRPRSSDVLRYLLERPGTLVSRDELMEALWAGTVVTEDAVTQCLIDIRKAIGDGSQTMIRTVPRRGYIFELPVETVGDSEEASPRRQTDRRWVIVAGLFVLAVAIALVALLLSEKEPPPISAAGPGDEAAPSIAVMPFESMSRDGAQSYFADGVSEEIINSLASQQDMRVIARTSSFSFRDENVDVATIADRLDVSHVLEGSVRIDGDALRINVQLVDAGTGEYLWTRQFDRELSASSVFAIQSEIAAAVVESLQRGLPPQDRARLSRIPTDDMAALDAYFEARQAMETRHPDELERAAGLLRRAIEIDPDFALAYVSLAETLRLQTGYGTLPWSVVEKEGMAAIKRAIEIDDRLGEAYASLGNLLAVHGDYIGAEEAFLRGIELSPSYAPLYQWYGEFLHIYVARPEEAVSYSRMAVALDPRSAVINRDYGLSLVAAGRFEDAIARFDAVVDIDPGFAPIYHDKGMIQYAVFGRIAEAIPLMEQTRSMSPSSPFVLNSLAAAFGELGEYDRSGALLDEAHALAPGSPAIAVTKTKLYTVLGDSEAAMENAEIVLAAWPWHVEALRFLRDYELRTRGVDAAIDHYRYSFSPLLGEQSPVIGPSNYAAAIDIAYLLRLKGREERANQLLEEVQPLLENRPRITWFMSPLADVKIQAILGNNERALELLRTAVDEGWRTSWRFELEHDVALASLREEPEFHAIIDTIEDDMARQRQQLRDAQ